MKIKEYILSGILELYVLDSLSAEEKQEVKKHAAHYPEVAQELKKIEQTLEVYLTSHALQPRVELKEQILTKIKEEQQSADPTIKAMEIAFIDYNQRVNQNELIGSPSILNESSTIRDYAEWLDRKDFIPAYNNEDVFVKIMAMDSKSITAVVWLKQGSPYETHENEIEKFLILEGSCEIVTEQKVYSLSAGDYFSIPLHLNHKVKVTSTIPCKIILQRVAA